MTNAPNQSLPGSRFFTAGCAVAILTGIVKAATHFITPPAPANPDETELNRLMTTYVIPELGRSTEEILHGFSWWFALAMAAPAIIALILRRGRASDFGLLRTLSIGHALMMGVGLAISLRYFFAIPTGFIGTTFALYAAAAIRTCAARPAL